MAGCLKKEGAFTVNPPSIDALTDYENENLF
jgi:hypothetical protein